MTTLPTRQYRLYSWLLLFLTSFFLICAIWLPFGFSLMGLVEEWGFLDHYANQDLFFIINSSGPIATHAFRPLMIFFHSLAYLLDPNSFNYWHLLLMLSLLINGFVFAYLIKKTTGSMQWALLAGVLLLVYPADTMQISFRDLNIKWALSFQLLASWVFILATQTERLVTYLCASVFAATLMLASICMYEVIIPLLLLPLLMIYAKEGFIAAFNRLRARKILIICWLAALVIYLLYAYDVTSKMEITYLTYCLKTNIDTTFWGLITQPAYSKLFSIGALRALVRGMV